VKALNLEVSFLASLTIIVFRLQSLSLSLTLSFFLYIYLSTHLSSIRLYAYLVGWRGNPNPIIL
jgi:hypothetical protein